MTLPADAHVHSEWSWDTGGPASGAAGTMRRTCERAVRIGLPALIFTEHLDLDDAWRLESVEDLMPAQRYVVDERGFARPPLLDVDGYLAAVDRCRHDFPELRILTGLELGQPHLFGGVAAELLDLSAFDRINGSLHTLANGHDRSEPNSLFRIRPPEQVIDAYLEEVPRMVAAPGLFEVVTHIDYAVRSWPTETAGPFDPKRFEGGFRAAMRAIAASGRALELNTNRLWSWIPQWWSEEGGRAITFGSDAHLPAELARHFPEAVLLAEQYGFREGPRPEDPWTR
jgi:histidinol-phosphatase (PHP family)